ncbi:hypothetical protein RFI_24703, partial [Reticulomyxa filosa]
MKTLETNKTISNATGMNLVEAIVHTLNRLTSSNTQSLANYDGHHIMLQALRHYAVSPQIAIDVTQCLQVVEHNPIEEIRILFFFFFCKYIVVSKSPQNKQTKKKSVAKLDEKYLSNLQLQGVVNSISAALTYNPENGTLVREGKTALQLFAASRDLENALQIIQTAYRNGFDHLHSDLSSSIQLLANLALIPSHCDYIVTKGDGIQLLVGCITYLQKKVDSGDDSVECIDILSGCIRALGRLLTDDDKILAFQKCHGVRTLQGILSNSKDEETIMNACVDCLQHMLESKMGRDLVLFEKYGLMEDIVDAFGRHPEYDSMVNKLVCILSSVVDTPVLSKLIQTTTITNSMCKRIVEHLRWDATADASVNVIKMTDLMDL